MSNPAEARRRSLEEQEKYRRLLAQLKQRPKTQVVVDLKKELTDAQRDLNQVRQDLGKSGASQQKTRETIQQIEQKRDEIKRVVQARSSVQQKAERIREIRDEIKELTPGGKIREFLKETPTKTRPRVQKGVKINIRKDVLRPALTSLQEASDILEASAGFASEEEINEYLRKGGRYTDPKRFAPKTSLELFSRIGLVVTSGTKGAIKDFTFPISWGISPPKTKTQQASEFMGAVFIPSPTDYAVTKTLSALGRTVKGRKLFKILSRGNPGEISDNADEIIRYIDEYGKIQEVKVTTTKGLMNIANDIDELKKIIPEEKLLDQAMGADDLLSTISKDKNWRKGLGIDELLNPDESRKAIKAAKEAIEDSKTGFDILFKLDPDDAVAFSQLSPRDQAKVVKKVTEILKFWEEEGANIYTLGAAYEPELITLSKQIVDQADPKLMKELLLETDTSAFSPAALSLLIEGLGKPSSKDDPNFGVVPDLKVLEDQVVTFDDIQEELDAVDNQLRQIEETIIKDIEAMDEEEDIVPIVEPVEEPIQVPEQAQRQDQFLEEIQVEEPIEEEPTKQIFTPKEQEQRRQLNLKLFRGTKDKYRVNFRYTQARDEAITVEARSYPEAIQKAQKQKPIRRELPNSTIITKVK